VLTRTSVTYVLTVQPEIGKRDGAFRKLKVELKGAAGKGALVTARSGYYAPREKPGESAMERVLSTASLLYDDTHGSAFPLAVWAAPFRLPATPAAYVPVLLEVDGPGLTAKAASGTLPAENLRLRRRRRRRGARLLQPDRGLDLAKVGGAAFGQRAQVLRTSRPAPRPVHPAHAGAQRQRRPRQPLGAAAVGPRAAEPDLLPLLFPETPGRWVMVREVPRGAAKEVPYPFLVEQQPFIPANAPLLEGGKELPAVVFAYHLPAGEVKRRSPCSTGTASRPGQGRSTWRRASRAGPSALTASRRRSSCRRWRRATMCSSSR